jgi:hypothetical protein
MIDLVYGTVLDGQNQVGSKFAGPEGRAYGLGHASNWLLSRTFSRFPTTEAVPSVTLLWFGYFYANPVGANAPICGLTYDSTATDHSISLLRRQSSTVDIYMRYYTGSYTELASGAFTGTYIPLIVACGVRPSLQTVRAYRAYRGNIRVNQFATSNHNILLGSTPPKLFIGPLGGANESNTITFYVALFNRELSDVELKQIVFDPWTLFESRRWPAIYPGGGAAVTGGVASTAAQAPAGLSYMGTGLSKACQPAGLAPMG